MAKKFAIGLKIFFCAPRPPSPNTCASVGYKSRRMIGWYDNSSHFYHIIFWNAKRGHPRAATPLDIWHSHRQGMIQPMIIPNLSTAQHLWGSICSFAAPFSLTSPKVRRTCPLPIRMNKLAFQYFSLSLDSTSPQLNYWSFQPQTLKHTQIVNAGYSCIELSARLQ